MSPNHFLSVDKESFASMAALPDESTSDVMN